MYRNSARASKAAWLTNILACKPDVVSGGKPNEALKTGDDNDAVSPEFFSNRDAGVAYGVVN
ncbi:hypothetical protein [Snodgrassella sp. CFCC 13594]|uniref:hypothetical protein n=1 Tax=Snodgrassella sp. CFCC 13594 TaxID=1775559 RepID=UPI0012E7740C|nr:hypothetical protein [Snodgrassella sp. CFCC 13594]